MTDEPTGLPPHEEDEPQFTGTLFVLMVYVMLLAGMWGAVYFMLLGR